MPPGLPTGRSPVRENDAPIFTFRDEKKGADVRAHQAGRTQEEAVFLRTGIEYAIVRQANQSPLYPEIVSAYIALLCR